MKRGGGEAERQLVLKAFTRGCKYTETKFGLPSATKLGDYSLIPLCAKYVTFTNFTFCDSIS